MFSFARLFVQTNEKVNAVLMSFLGRPSAHRNYRVALDSPKSELSGKKIRQREFFYQRALVIVIVSFLFIVIIFILQSAVVLKKYCTFALDLASP